MEPAAPAVELHRWRDERKRSSRSSPAVCHELTSLKQEARPARATKCHRPAGAGANWSRRRSRQGGQHSRRDGGPRVPGRLVRGQCNRVAPAARLHMITMVIEGRRESGHGSLRSLRRHSAHPDGSHPCSRCLHGCYWGGSYIRSRSRFFLGGEACGTSLLRQRRDSSTASPGQLGDSLPR